MYNHNLKDIEDFLSIINKNEIYSEPVRILYYEEKEIMKGLPDWIPPKESILTTFLIQHPEKISKNAKLIGLEIFNIDILFEDSNNIYIVEVKYFNRNSITCIIERAVSQLKNYYNIIEQQDINKKIIPVIAIMDYGIIKFVERKRKMKEEKEEIERRLKF